MKVTSYRDCKSSFFYNNPIEKRRYLRNNWSENENLCKRSWKKVSNDQKKIINIKKYFGAFVNLTEESEVFVLCKKRISDIRTDREIS